MSDTLAVYKIKLKDYVSTGLANMGKNLNAVEKDVGKFETTAKKGIGKTSKKMSVLNNLGRLTAARNGLSSFSSITRIAASGMNPLVIGLGLAAAGAAKLGYEMAKTGVVIQKNLQIANQLLGGNAQEVSKVTTKAMALSNVYGGDYTSTIQAAAKLTQQFGLSNEQAFKIIKDGYASGANLSGDMLKTIEDSAYVFKNLGASAEQQMAILQQSISKGIQDAPKLLESFNDNLPDLGGDVKRLLDKNFGEGFSKNLKKNLKNGEATAVHALKAISDAVGQTDMSAKTKQGLAEQLFGDKSGSAVELLSNFAKFDTKMSGLVKKNDKFNKAKSEQLALEERLARAQLRSSAGFASLAQSGQKFLIRAKIGFYETINYIGSMYAKIRDLFSALSGLATRVTSIKVLTNTVKVAWNVLTTTISTTWKALTFVIGGTFDFVTNGLNFINEKIDQVMGSNLVVGIKNGFLEIKSAFSGMLDYIATPLSRLKDALEGIFTMLKGIKNFDYDQIKEGLSEVKSGINGTTQREREKKPVSGKDIGKAIVAVQKKEEKSDVSKQFNLSSLEKEKKVTKELNASTQKIQAGGVRNITVNVGVLKSADNIVVEGSKGLNLNQVEMAIKEMLVRLIQGTERSISRG